MWWRIGVLVLILGASTANAQDVFPETQPSALFSGNEFFVAVNQRDYPGHGVRAAAD